MGMIINPYRFGGAAPVIIDYLGELNSETSDIIHATSGPQRGQSFLCSVNSILDSSKFYMLRNGSPTGNIYSKIYAHTGTYGAGGVATGLPLATSDGVDISGLSTSVGLVKFEFTGLNRINLNSGTNYVVSFEFSGGDSSNYAKLYRLSVSNLHGGNRCYKDGASWYAQTADWIFYVYGI